MEKDFLIIGAGLTGLTTAFALKQKGFSVAVLEKNDYVGGQIRTLAERGFLFESGPNTGVISSIEVSDLFDELQPDCEVEFAKPEAESRRIWKDGKFHPLPNGLWGGITTPLFTFSDKFRILGEPFRAKGTNPDESVASLAARRLGKSFVDYAVNPFLSGIYAGDPNMLITRHALPKLYNLEQNYGSFIGGSIAKAKEKKAALKNGEKTFKKGIFSIKSGLSRLPEALAKRIGSENVFLSVNGISILPKDENHSWITIFAENGEKKTLQSQHVVFTVGAYALPDLMPFIDEAIMRKITNIRYAPIVQAAVGIDDRDRLDFKAFGGLVSSKDGEDVLGILFPSACFDGRAPEKGALFSFFMGGIQRPDIFDRDDAQLENIVVREFHRMLKFPAAKNPDFIRLFRHKHAIPQYEISTDERLEAVSIAESRFSGLHILGNLRDGIGMANRMEQGLRFAEKMIRQI
ncbi:MAG: protoporphyrinogen oxidase [Dysgonamonadaceae bacterium]|jgi:oxygen-dependent protoporphyrinogen oxidase|nr:protoporphyrinogen oxidase [Dysgonamonadaceae bacterium]